MRKLGGCMNFEEAEREYLKFKNRLDARQISPQDYLNHVNNLRLQDPTGTWWHIRQEDGRWLKWNGTSWILSQPPTISASEVQVQMAKTAPKPALVAGKSPETLPELIITIVKGIVPGFLKNLPLTILIIVIVWALHTYLLVVINEGFNYDGSLVSQMLATGGREATGTLFWLLIGYFVAILVYKIRYKDLGNSISRLKTVPSWVSTSFQGAGTLSVPTILAGAGIAALIGAVLNDRVVALQLTLLMLGALVAQQNSMLSLAIRLGWSDLKRRNVKGFDTHAYNPSWAVMGVFGAVIGWVAATVFPLDYLYLIIIAVILIVPGVYLIFQHSKNPVTHALLLVLLSVLSLIALFGRVVADDGGWQESGGTFGQWSTSQGATIAVVMGAPPAVGAAVGSVLGTTVVTTGSLYPPGPYIGDKREYIDVRGIKRDAVLREDGYWVDEQEQVAYHPDDFNNLDKFRDQYEKDKAWIQDQQQIEIEKSKTDMEDFTKRLEENKNFKSQDHIEFDNWQKDQLKQEQDLYRHISEKYTNRGVLMDNITTGLESGKYICDKSIDVLGTITGPVGKNIATVYKAASNIGDGLGEGLADTKNFGTHLGKGVLKAGVDFITDKATDAGFEKAGDLLKGTKPGKIIDFLNKEVTPGDVGWSSDPLNKLSHLLPRNQTILARGLGNATKGWIKGYGPGMVTDEIKDNFIGN